MWIATGFALLMVLSLVSAPALAGASLDEAPERATPTGTDYNRIFDANEGASLGGDIRPGASAQQGSDQRRGSADPIAQQRRGNRRGSADPIDQVERPDVDANTTTELLVEARTQVEEMDDGQRPQLQAEIQRSLNASIDEYYAATLPTSEAAFEHQREAYRGLHRLSRYVDDDRIETAKENVRTATELSGRLTVFYANSTVAQFDEELRGRDRRSAERQLNLAAQSIQRVPPNRVSYGRTYAQSRNAWREATDAIDTVEEATSPEITLEQGPAREAGEGVNVSARITLSDVRAYAYEEATVTFDDGSTETIPLRSRTTPGVAQGFATVELGPDIEPETITASASRSDDPSRTVEETIEITVDEDDVIPERPAPDEYNEITVTDDQSGVTVDAGGEGLYNTDIAITDRTPETDDSYRVGPVVRLENRSDFDSAEVTIPITEDVTQEEAANLTVYKMEPGDASGWRPVETDIDLDAGTATVEADSFSYFSIFNQRQWNDYLTETITLEDRYVEGSLDDEGGSDGSRADFMLTIDESGSMYPDEIEYARAAARTFVDSTYDEERVGLAWFSGANTGYVDVGLTRDKDRVKQNIGQPSISTAATDLTSGIEASINELSANGREDRSQVMILLADGGASASSYDPVEAAKDASNQGITINTVGLTNSADEEILQDIADATGGSYYFVEDPEDLPDTFDRVSDESRVELTDTSDNGIPDAVADANPEIPQLAGRYGGNSRININPAVADTNGDGVSDEETIGVSHRVFSEDGELKLEARVDWARYHPARLDVDGDGVTGRNESERTRILISPNQSSSQDFLQGLGNLDEDATLEEVEAVREQHLEEEFVRSSPFTYRTSVGAIPGEVSLRYGVIGTLNDSESYRLGVDPEAVDTTGDGLPDYAAVTEMPDHYRASDQLDPTLFDYRAPEINIEDVDRDDRDIFTWPTNWEAREDFIVTAEVADDTGIQETRIEIDGDSEWSDQSSRQWLNDEIDEGRATADFVDSFADTVMATRVQVVAEDQYGNTGYRIARSNTGVIGGLSEAIAENSEYVPGSDIIVMETGAVQGLTTGGAETITGIFDLITNPDRLTAIFNISLPDIEEIPEAIQRQQQRDNPHYDETAENPDCGSTCESFRLGWYRGYAAAFILEGVVGSKGASRAANGLNRIESASDGLVSSAASAALRVGEYKTRAESAVVFRLASGLRTTASISLGGAQRALGAGRSVAERVRVSRGLRQLDSVDFERPDIDETRIGRYLARGGDPAVVRRAIDSPCSPGSLSSVQLPASGLAGDSDRLGTGSSAVTVQSDPCDIDLDSPIRQIDDEDFRTGLIQAVENADLGESSARRLARMSDEGAPDAYRRAMVDAAGEVKADKLNSVVDEVDGLVGTDRMAAQRLIAEEGSTGIRLVGRQVEDSDFDTVGSVSRNYLELDSDTKAHFREFTDVQGSGGFRLAADLDSDQLSTLVNVDSIGDVSYSNWNQWRSTLIESNNLDAVPNRLVGDYIDEVGTLASEVSKRNGIDIGRTRNLRAALNDLEGSPSAVQNVQFETQRAVDALEGPDADRVDDVEFEPDASVRGSRQDVDLEIDWTGNDYDNIYIENKRLRNTDSSVGSRDIISQLDDDKFDPYLEAGDITDNDLAVIEVDTSLRSGYENSVENIQDDVARDVFNRFSRRNPDITDFRTDEIRVTNPDGSVTVGSVQRSDIVEAIENGRDFEDVNAIEWSRVDSEQRIVYFETE